MCAGGAGEPHEEASQSCTWRTSAKSPRPPRPSPLRGGRGRPMTRSIVTRGVRVRPSTVACQRGVTHNASSTATPSATYRGRPYQSARPSASVSSARGCCGASGSRALRMGIGPSCASTRVRVGPGRTPIQRVCIGRLLEGELAGDGDHRRRRCRHDDARGRGRLGSLMRHFFWRRAAGGPGACAGSDGWRRAAWSGERPGRTRASSSDRHDRSGDTRRRPAGSRVVRRRSIGRSPPSPALRREGWTIPRGYATRETAAIAPRDSAPRGLEWLDSGPLTLSSAVGGSRSNLTSPSPATTVIAPSPARAAGGPALAVAARLATECAHTGSSLGRKTAGGAQGAQGPPGTPRRGCQDCVDGTGELSYAKVRALTRVATPETEARLLGVGRGGTAAQVERIVRGWRRVDRQAEAKESARQHASRALHVYDDEDGTVVVRGRLAPEVGALLRRALAAARETLYQQ